MKYAKQEGGTIKIGPARKVKAMGKAGKLAAIWLSNYVVFDYVLGRKRLSVRSLLAQSRKAHN